MGNNAIIFNAIQNIGLTNQVKRFHAKAHLQKARGILGQFILRHTKQRAQE